MNEPIAIVGAGLSGLLLARELAAAGHEVIVLEKSRGVGGRLATKRAGAAVFDQGAQFFTARAAPFAALVAAWQVQGVVAAWPGAPAPRLVGQPSMNALGKALAATLPVRRECRVLSANPTAGVWTLQVENQPPVRARALALTAPVPQSLALLDAGGVVLPPALRTQLEALTYHPCLALLLTLDGPSAVPAEGVAPEHGPVRWLADNTKKGISPGVPAAVTVHLNPAFSATHYNTPEEELLRLVLPGITAWLGAAVTGAVLHRWKFSEPVATHPDPCVWLPALGLGFAGDAFGGPRVEGAALSGLALAAKFRGTPAA
ncbi:MAG: FAD-dependent oxidoreductase [Opitutaceae bacterium]|nr:FAD-dependent oxidoreductase [Opitutaceae bacterium]MBP9913090.1 FAD-dependent oxidoreductase [Opitutaceae bacterium]